MKKLKKNKIEKGNSQSIRPKAGLYGPEYRSPQAVEWLKGTQLSYLRSSAERAAEIKNAAREYAQQRNMLRNMAEFQGGSTVCFRDRNKMHN